MRVVQGPATFRFDSQMAADAVAHEQAHKTGCIELECPISSYGAGEVCSNALRNDGTDTDAEIELIRFRSLRKSSTRYQCNAKKHEGTNDQFGEPLHARFISAGWRRRL